MANANPTGLRNDHLLWVVGAILVAIVLFFPSEFEGASQLSATGDATESVAEESVEPVSPWQEDTGTFARSEPFTVEGKFGEQKSTSQTRYVGEAGPQFSVPKKPVASAAVPESVFAAGEHYRAKTEGCGDAAGCSRR